MPGALAKRWLCRVFGHEWVAADLRYEQGETMALVGRTWERIAVTWVSDERCRRCGSESQWPA